jgi:hypothetical protein
MDWAFWCFPILMTMNVILFWGIITGLVELHKSRLAEREFEKHHHSLRLFISWRKARPFLFVGQCPYAQGLVHAIIDSYERAYELLPYLEANEQWLESWRRLLHEMPPHHDPPSKPHWGFAFSLKFSILG